ncbi:unnamed protein product [Rhizophagus irregularis]|nr:unnamed protein product [Rhizophagus irregularis]
MDMKILAGILELLKIPILKTLMIIMPYYDSADLIHYITKNFHSISWATKLWELRKIVGRLIQIHKANIVHRDFHSGNILLNRISLKFIRSIKISVLGRSNSATESGDDNENYGIVPYMAPEIFQRQKYDKASDIYSLGMVMWELMTSRRPFWDRSHDTDLIIDICDGLRPPIVTNAPEGYIELMEECWHSNPEKRSSATDIHDKLNKIIEKEDEKIKNKKLKL